MNKRLPAHLTLLGLLALSACSQPATPTAPPSPAQPTGETAPAKATLGMYELRMNGLGTPQAQASVERAGPGAQALGAQATEISGLSFTPYGTTTIADSVNRVLYISSTFTVENRSGTDLAVPTYVPVDTAGAYATDGQTPFRNVVSRKGVPISPAGLQLDQGRMTSGGQVVPDPYATPLVPDLDTGGLQLQLPADTTAPGISHRGWQSQTPLPAGAGVGLPEEEKPRVTFAMRVALQGSDVGDNDPFRFSLVFAVTDNPGTLKLSNVAQVQGATPSGDAASPLASQSALVEGVVTADYRTTTQQGFYLQEEGLDADGDPATSDGVFVYCGAACSALPATLSVGDRVRVQGTVGEFVTVTQLDVRSGQVTLLSEQSSVPDATPLTLPLEPALRERLEGMRVTARGVVTNNYPLGRGASFDIAERRLPTYTQVNAPDVAGNAAYLASLPAQTLRIDDGSRAQNPDPEPFARASGGLSAENTLRGGDTVTATGVLSYGNDGWTGAGSLDTYRLHATPADVQVEATNPRLGAPEAVGGTLRAGSMNVLNYFTTLVTSNDGCTPNGTSSSARGANNCAEFTRQQTKTVKAILGLNADVLGLLEIQNDFAKGAGSSVATLVSALNAEAGSGTYAYIDPGANVGGDAISVAMIYKPAAVSPVGRLAILDNSFDPNYLDSCNRPTWAQTFQSRENGGRFTAVMAHLKSKGSACAALGDTDRGDGQGNAWKAREQAAQVISNWLATNPTGVTEDDRLLMGDFNAYAQETALSVLAQGGYRNLFGSSAYSYQFDGQWGSLDHALASASLAGQVSGQTKWHINADEPVVLDYNTEFKTPAQLSGYYAPTPYRSSDHDPVLVGLNLGAQEPLTPTQPAPAPAPTLSLSAQPSSLSVTAGGPTASSTLSASTQNYSGGNLSVSSSAPSGLSVSAPASVAPNGSFTLSVTAAPDLAPGTYPVTVTASGDGGLSSSVTLNVTVTAAGTTPPSPSGGGLILSEYVEGSSNNKAVELYNAGDAAVNLSLYKLELYSNGATTPGNVQPLSGTLAPGATLVFVNGSASAELKAKGTVSAVTNFNGDDALVLRRDTEVVDSFGQVGAQIKWGENVTLRRKVGVVSGDTNPGDAFSAANEWDSFPIDTFSGLGSR